MTDQSSPINPPTKLVQQWKLTAPHPSNETEHYRYIAICAAVWGSHQRGAINEAQLQERADQELEACCEWTQCDAECGDSLRKARRPKPLTLKKEALKRLESLEKLAEACGHDPDNTIRLALEQLND